MGRYTTEHGYLYPNARSVHLDSKPHLVMSGGRSADCYVQTDAKAGVEALENALAKRSVKMTGFRTGGGDSTSDRGPFPEQGQVCEEGV